MPACASPGYLKMFTARETTSTATTSEIASSDIIMSLAQGLIAETSVGLKAVAAVNERCRITAGRRVRTGARHGQLINR